MNISAGSITDTKYWISYESRPFKWWRWDICFRPTYNGTKAGVILMLPFCVVIGHIREP